MRRRHGVGLLGRQANPKCPVRIKLSVGLGASPEGQSEIDYVIEAGLVQQYQIDVGLRTPTSAAFLLEPQIEEETLTHHHGRRTVTLLERKGPAPSCAMRRASANRWGCWPPKPRWERCKIPRAPPTSTYCGG